MIVIRCPDCKQQAVISLGEGMRAQKRCMKCGLTFMPLQFTPDEFAKWDKGMKLRRAGMDREAQHEFNKMLEIREQKAN